MSIRKAILASAGIVASVFNPAPAPAQELPQTQMAAAAVVIGTIVFPGMLIRASRVVSVENNRAHLRGNLPGTGSSDADASDVDVVKVDDCHFEAIAVKSGSRLAVLNLNALSDEYRQGLNGSVTIRGTGRERAVCYSFNNWCYDDLALGFNGQGAPGESAWRALRAAKFLQQYCPPQPLGF
jgi:hypothetical protein